MHHWWVQWMCWCKHGAWGLRHRQRHNQWKLGDPIFGYSHWLQWWSTGSNIENTHWRKVNATTNEHWVIQYLILLIMIEPMQIFTFEEEKHTEENWVIQYLILLIMNHNDDLILLSLVLPIAYYFSTLGEHSHLLLYLKSNTKFWVSVKTEKQSKSTSILLIYVLTNDDGDGASGRGGMTITGSFPVNFTRSGAHPQFRPLLHFI